MLPASFEPSSPVASGTAAAGSAEGASGVDNVAESLDVVGVVDAAPSEGADGSLEAVESVVAEAAGADASAAGAAASAKGSAAGASRPPSTLPLGNSSTLPALGEVTSAELSSPVLGELEVTGSWAGAAASSDPASDAVGAGAASSAGVVAEGSPAEAGASVAGASSPAGCTAAGSVVSSVEATWLLSGVGTVLAPSAGAEAVLSEGALSVGAELVDAVASAGAEVVESVAVGSKLDMRSTPGKRVCLRVGRRYGARQLGERMADTETAVDPGHWLDISVHKRVHRKLTAWGRRLGLTPEGYAKLLILQGMHSLLADEVAKQARVPRESMADGPSENELARSMWTAMLRDYADAPDLLPAPREVVGKVRTYHSEDFTWPEGRRPPHDLVTWDGDKLALV